MDFTKKFNVGLTLDTNYSQFASFLKKYHTYIHSFYFSPPVNRFFHTRSRITQAFWLPWKRRLFWRMLKLIHSYGIELELLFNTLRLTPDRIGQAAALLERHGVEVDSVCFLGEYYDAVRTYFPGKKYILSFNNGYQRKEQIQQALEQYQVDVFVLGSAFIRNNKMFAYLAGEGKQTYLLLNNGCSFNCGTCNNMQSVCEETFRKNLRNHSIEYLYALQSIFPEELRNGTIDPTHVQCFKISNRSSNLKFLQGAMDSYIHDRVEPYVQADKNNFAYWGRAGYFWKCYHKMDLETIRSYKRQILHYPSDEVPPHA